MLGENRRIGVCSQTMARNMMLTGLDDLTVTRIRHWAETHGTTPSEYLARLAELHERLDSLAQSRTDEMRASVARELLSASRLRPDPG
jgi:hypothetical protein